MQSACDEIYGENISESFSETVFSGLKDDDREIVLNALSLIGRADIKTQENQLSEFVLRLERSLEELKSEAPLKQRLSLTVGTMTGVCTAIFLI